MARGNGFQPLSQQDHHDTDYSKKPFLPQKATELPLYKDQFSRGLTTESSIIVAVFALICSFGLGCLVASSIQTNHPQLLVSDSRLPNFPAVATTLEPEPEFVGITEDVDRAWSSLLPLGRGFVNMTNGEQTVKSCVSVFHQLHCLNQLRLHMRALEHPELPYADKKSNHVQHCIEYLRVSILCASDMTLEEHTHDEKEVEGWGYVHQCRDRKSVYDWITKHRSSNKMGGIL